MNTPLTIGAEAKTAACQYLQKHHLQIRERNYRCKLGEIDIIAQEGETIVFVEVRRRSHHRFGDGFASVDRNKQKKLIRTAKAYLLERQLFEKHPCRFDIVSTTSPEQLSWIKNAFQAE